MTSAASDPSPTAPTVRALPILLLLVAAALVLRLPNYGQSVWFDEACMSTQRIGTWPQVLATLYVDIHPPLYVCFMYLWNSVFGDSEISMRLPSLLCGLASIPLTFSVGRRLVGRSAAMWAAALLSLSPVHVWYSIEARLYAPMLLLVLAAVALYQKLLLGARARTWIAYGAVLVAMVGLHYYLAPFVLLLAGLAPIHARRRGRPGLGWRIVLVNGAALGLLAIWVGFKFLFAEFETSQGYLQPLTMTGTYSLLFQWFWTGNCVPAGLQPSWHARYLLWIAFQVLGVLLFAAGIVRLWRLRRERPEAGLALLFLLALPALLLVLPWVGYPNTYIQRSILPAMPFFFMITGLGLTAVRPARLRLLAGGMVIAMCAANLIAYYTFADLWTVYKPHPEWRGAAAYLGAEIENGAKGRPVFTSMPNPRSLSYYDARIQHELNLAPTEDKIARLVPRLRQRFGGLLADFAEDTAKELERQKAELSAAACLMVYPSGDGSLAALNLAERRRDGVFYLVWNHLHPPGDDSIRTLLNSPRLRVLETRRFSNITVYKVQELDG